MAGIETPNIPTHLLSQFARSTRGSEIPDANFLDGANKAGSCAPGMGIATGFYDPKEQDWPRIEDVSPHLSQHIGGLPVNQGNQAFIPIATSKGENWRVAFVQADALTAPDAILDATTGALNRTGDDVPADAWVWGEIPP